MSELTALESALASLENVTAGAYHDGYRDGYRTAEFEAKEERAPLVAVAEAARDWCIAVSEDDGSEVEAFMVTVTALEALDAAALGGLSGTSQAER